MKITDGFFDAISQTEDQIRYNCRIKKYPDGSCDLTIAERRIFRAAGWEERDPEPLPERAEPEEAAALDRAKRRARSAVYDLVLSNCFEYFVTLTLDKEKINRYDVGQVTRHIGYWLDNAVRRRGLAYVLVPERHKDGAIHFHGFFNDALEGIDSGALLPPGGGRPRKPRSMAQRSELISLGAKPIYNLPRWGWGFSTAVRLDGNLRRAIGYICKYITKGEEKIGGRWYYSGGDLRRPEVVLCNVAFEDFCKVENSDTYIIPGMDCRVVSLTVEGGGKVE